MCLPCFVPRKKLLRIGDHRHMIFVLGDNSMAYIKFHCTHCSQKLEAPEEGAGRSLACPACAKQIQIPASRPLAVEPAQAEATAAQPDEETPGQATEQKASAGGGKKWRLPQTGSGRRPATRSKSRKGGCSNCGEELKPGAVLCVACGFNVKTGKKIRTKL